MTTNTRNLLILGGFLATAAAGVVAIGANIQTTQVADTNIEAVCRAALTQKEQANYATFQINNAVTEADGTVRLYYAVGYGADNKERQLADCTGTPDAVQLRLTTVEAKEAAAAF
jgi:hypothetical protein